jgi:hypothetical protein
LGIQVLEELLAGASPADGADGDPTPVTAGQQFFGGGRKPTSLA